MSWTERFTDPSLPEWNTGRHLNGYVRTDTANRSYRAVIPAGEHFGTDIRRSVGAREALMRYRVKRSPNFIEHSRWGGKMLGFADLRWNNSYGHRDPGTWGGDGGSWRGLFGGGPNRPGHFGVYIYHLDQGQSYGDSIFFGEGSPDGQWSDYELYVNVPEGYGWGTINGGAKTEFRFRVSDETLLDIAWLDVYHGGNQTPVADIWLEFDDVEVEYDSLGNVISVVVLERGDGYQQRLGYRDDVRRAQAWLAISGFIAANTFDSRHRPDGKYGPGTEQAVRNFQNATGLPVTGKVDLATWNSLSVWGRR